MYNEVSLTDYFSNVPYLSYTNRLLNLKLSSVFHRRLMADFRNSEEKGYFTTSEIA